MNHNAVNFNILRNCTPNIEKQNLREKAHEPALLLCSVDESPPCSRYQLRCLKQGDMSLEEFVIKARLLIDDGGYISALRESTLWDTLVFGIKSDKVRKDSIALA